MSNFKSTNLVKTNQPIVVSFDISQNTEEYSIGVATSANENVTPNHSLKVLINKIDWVAEDGDTFKSYTTDHPEFENNTIVYNLNNYFLGHNVNFLLDSSYFDSNYHTQSSNHEYSFFDKASYDKKIIKPIQDNLINLGYKCYLNTEQFTKEQLKDIPFFDGFTYFYQTDIEVVPFVCTYKNTQQEDDVSSLIALQYNGNQLVLLGLDYGISVDPSVYDISTIESIIDNNVIKTEYTKFKKFDKVRFVISDYGRIISHAVQQKEKETTFNNNVISVFDVDKIENPISVRFYVNDDSSISNITANF